MDTDDRIRRAADPPVGRAQPQPRRLGRAARPAAEPGARAEGRPRANLDPAAGRAISRLSGRCARAEARDRGRLSRDGGVARLPQILPAAAQGPRGRPEPRGDRASAADAAAAARRDARSGRAAARPRPRRPRRLPARRSRRPAPGPQGGVAGARFRPVRGLWRGPGADPAGDARRPCALGDDARGSDRARRADDRHRARLDLPRKLPSRDAGPAVPPLGAGLELPRDARARAPRTSSSSRRTSRSRRSSSKAA